MRKTNNVTIDKAIATQLAYYRALYYWVHRENDAKPMSEENRKALKMGMMIQDYKNHDGVSLKSLVRVELEKLEETDEDEYERIVSMFGSVDKLICSMVYEARAEADEIILKKFSSRLAYNEWFYKKERQSYAEFEAQHPELDCIDLMTDYADQWGLRSEEDVIVAAAMDGYDLSDGAPLSENA